MSSSQDSVRFLAGVLQTLASGTGFFLVLLSRIVVFGLVQTERFEAKNKRADEIGRFAPSDWSNRDKEGQETDWARDSFWFLFNRFRIF